ncbi:uncharacterized protein si:dkey-229b18.3 isoform X2 [Betta splendens]|uniref:Uncharacterized protein si:dkey-229b18.3 isoform X2 n=1 Tax=Betta splendens TaxID=158456 RepID=A0A6P7LF20_BETSP|nr:uncharacterized protein si:dkey-229b18.3 isoform X2 [Betta splendens]
MAGDCSHTDARYANSETLCPSEPWSAAEADTPEAMELVGGAPTARPSRNFEMMDGLLYRKKLEKGFINYREVLDEKRRHEAIATFHRRRPGQHHLSLEETYKCVAENYWWDGMYFQIRDVVLSCPECQTQSSMKTEEPGGRRCVTKTLASHSAGMLSKLRSQREAGLFCDITLRTNGRSYSAHRAVLAAVSDHFQEIFTEMDSSMKADIDLTGFSEDSLLSLLDFSYSSTLRVHQKDLPEVFAMARHLGMWPAVEACSALMKEQEQHRERKGKKLSGLEDNANNCYSLTMDASDESFEGSPRRTLRRMAKTQSHNGLPLSPSHRMKLMDFKSPSSKKAATPRQTMTNIQSQNYPSISPSNTRLLRSSPAAAKEVQRLLPMSESPRQNRKPHSITRLTCTPAMRTSTTSSPVRVKQEVEEVGEDEEDYARAQEKYKLMNVLGLQRTALLPRPEDLIGWRQKKRLRKLKANNYSLTKRRKPRPTSPSLPYEDMPLSLPLCNPVHNRLLNKTAKAKTLAAAVGKPAKRPKTVQSHVPPSDRSMRSKGVLLDLFKPAPRSSFGGRELRRSVRRSDCCQLPVQQPLRHNTNKTTVRVKSEPAEYSISGFSISSDTSRQQKMKKSPPTVKTQTKSSVTAETARTPRYNSSRPATKAKLRRGSAKQVEKTKCRPREEGRKVGSQGMGGAHQPGAFQLPEHAPPPSIYSHPLYKAIKEEPADPVPVCGPFSDPPSPDLGKRQSKPPIKLLDSGFLFSFCRPPGGPMALKKEEESVDIFLTRSVSQVGEKFRAVDPPHRALRARGPPAVVKKEREERPLRPSRVQKPRLKSRSNLHRAKPARPEATRTMSKQGKVLTLGSKACAMLDAVRRARLKQLRGPRSQAPKVPKAAHACLECPTTYRDCDALIMHRLRHIEGKHWPCPLCSKTFFRLRNVRNHIRTHDPKLYKCRSCIVADSKC